MYKRLSDGKVVDVVKCVNGSYTMRPEWLAKAEFEGIVSRFEDSLLVAKGSYKHKIYGVGYLVWDGVSITLYNASDFIKCFEEVSNQEFEYSKIIVQYAGHKLEIINVISFDSFTVKTKFAEYTLGSGWLWIEKQR